MATTTALLARYRRRRPELADRPELTKPLYYLPLQRLGRARLANSGSLHRHLMNLGRPGNCDQCSWRERPCARRGGAAPTRWRRNRQCHALVTPLCWPDGTTFGGPPKLGSDAQGEATYAHALVHRREAWHPGEYGTGWHNAAFWYGSLSTHAVGAEIQERVRQLAFKAAGDTRNILRQVLKEYLEAGSKVLNGALSDALLDATCRPVLDRKPNRHSPHFFRARAHRARGARRSLPCTVRGARRPAVIMKNKSRYYLVVS